MLPLFVLAVVALCLTIDAVVQQTTLAHTLTVQGERVGSAEWLRRILLVPAGMVVAPGHVWLRGARRGRIRVGADGLAAALLGEPERVQLPASGTAVARGQLLATLARDGREIELRSPIDGVVARVQTSLRAHPDRVARAPFGRGWLLELTPSRPLASLGQAHAGEAARRWLRGEMDRLRELVVGLAPVAEGVGATALDGGALLLPVSPALDDDGWSQARALFFPDGGAARQS